MFDTLCHKSFYLYLLIINACKKNNNNNSWHICTLHMHETFQIWKLVNDRFINYWFCCVTLQEYPLFFDKIIRKAEF
ncbi:hypothetical protein EUGRSUZ_J02216 [Eucalyptus grandis]|uniref:Uncharacterized protein n=2 Tax=Eucalyptus grandis TaxID=71139 RepID=A0ACC3JAC0_EUCGR|nr:hypothetical protein EUGRSUZ_J02216 [Eucalyptus grandis]